MRVLQVDIVHRRNHPRPYTLYSITSPLLPAFANTTRVAVLTKSAVHTGSIFLAIAYDMSSGEAAEGGAFPRVSTSSTLVLIDLKLNLRWGPRVKVCLDINVVFLAVVVV